MKYPEINNTTWDPKDQTVTVQFEDGVSVTVDIEGTSEDSEVLEEYRWFKTVEAANDIRHIFQGQFKALTREA